MPSNAPRRLLAGVGKGQVDGLGAYGPLEAEAATRTEALLRHVESDRNKLAQELEEFQRLTRGEDSDIVKRGEDMKGLLASLGLQLEQALVAIFEQDK